jgi:PemK-like, MazF-like toxin of type II toxin-antitoxin system
MEASSAPRPKYRPNPLRQGDMFQLSDEAFEFAENRGRVPHERDRCCIVVEGDESLEREDSQKVLIVPTSSRVDVKGPYDVFLPHPPSPHKDAMVRVEYMTPVLRDELGDYVQRLKPEYIDAIMASVASYLDLI